MKFRLKGWDGVHFIFIFVSCVSKITLLFIFCFLHCLSPRLFELVLGLRGCAVRESDWSWGGDE